MCLSLCYFRKGIALTFNVARLAVCCVLERDLSFSNFNVVVSLDKLKLNVWQINLFVNEC